MIDDNTQVGHQDQVLDAGKGAAGAMLLWVTAANVEEARRLSDAVLEARLAACVNIFPAMESAYRWQGRVKRNAEVGMFIKTTVDCAAACQAKLVEGHSYDLPCVLQFPIAGGHTDFLAWIQQQVLGTPCHGMPSHEEEGGL